MPVDYASYLSVNKGIDLTQPVHINPANSRYQVGHLSTYDTAMFAYLTVKESEQRALGNDFKRLLSSFQKVKVPILDQITEFDGRLSSMSTELLTFYVQTMDLVYKHHAVFNLLPVNLLSSGYNQRFQYVLNNAPIDFQLSSDKTKVPFHIYEIQNLFGQFLTQQATVRTRNLFINHFQTARLIKNETFFANLQTELTSNKPGYTPFLSQLLAVTNEALSNNGLGRMSTFSLPSYQELLSLVKETAETRQRVISTGLHQQAPIFQPLEKSIDPSSQQLTDTLLLFYTKMVQAINYELVSYDTPVRQLAFPSLDLDDFVGDAFFNQASSDLRSSFVQRMLSPLEQTLSDPVYCTNALWDIWIFFSLESQLLLFSQLKLYDLHSSVKLDDLLDDIGDQTDIRIRTSQKRDASHPYQLTAYYQTRRLLKASNTNFAFVSPSQFLV